MTTTLLFTELEKAPISDALLLLLYRTSGSANSIRICLAFQSNFGRYTVFEFAHRTTVILAELVITSILGRTARLS